MTLNVVADREADAGVSVTAAAPSQQAAQQQAAQATRLLLLAVQKLGERALVAIASLYSLLLAASAFWLAMQVLPDPSTTKLTGLGSYFVFVLALHWIRRR